MVMEFISAFALIRPKNSVTSKKSIFLQLEKEY